MDNLEEVSDELIMLEAEKTKSMLKLLNYKGDAIANILHYSSLDGIEAVQYYLVQKHHWFPSQVKAMSLEDLCFCMEEEEIRV